MKISFDLDDTLIPSQIGDFQVEERTMLQRVMGIELLRKDTKKAFQSLKNNGHKVGVYTTSFRSIRKIRTQFYTYGIHLDFVINEMSNRKKLRKIGNTSSKYPPAFGIDLHVDDSLGVKAEGEQYGFEVIILEKGEVYWIDKISSIL